MIALVDNRFKDFNFLLGDDGPVQASDEFFGFSGEHASTDHFYPACLFPRRDAAEVWFDKHGAKYPAGGDVRKSKGKLGGCFRPGSRICGDRESAALSSNDRFQSRSF